MSTLSKYPNNYDPTDYDWDQAWVYGGDTRRAHPTSTVSLAPLGPDDVDVVLSADEGENDGPEWLLYGVAKDGRYFFLSAGCDYTGWDCQAGGTMTVAHTAQEMLTFGMTDSDRSRLGV